MHDINKIHIVGNLSEAPVKKGENVSFIISATRKNLLFSIPTRLKIRVEATRSVATCAITLKKHERVYVEGSIFTDDTGTPYIVAVDIARLDHSDTFRGLKPDAIFIDEAVQFPERHNADTFSDLP